MVAIDTGVLIAANFSSEVTMPVYDKNEVRFSKRPMGYLKPVKPNPKTTGKKNRRRPPKQQKQVAA
jgi:hypothetical protein